ncbi:MAG: GatB/YqeY domain-containing protein [Candidatus Kryptonium sp.]|nr:GatB/YqeY domain-containing protein [Candidatus Kryptonium sp.]MCX7761924.1 GatB/YqeY domain-containing protein [Candidatus Kryptonium sp.]MDW8108744.1 GatB/YqeY domain-containing protein [Candidatus Kryptonium sp.]
MGLREKLAEDLKNAMKSGDKIRLEVVRMLQTMIRRKEIERKGEGKELTEEDEIQVVKSEIKKRKEAIELFEKGGRSDLAEKEKKELEILNEYLPEQMSEEEIEKFVEKVINEIGASGPKDVGKVMGAVMKELRGKADGALVQKIVKEKLQAQ